MQNRARRSPDGVDLVSGAMGVVGVKESRLRANVLDQRSTQRDVEDLMAAADAENGFLCRQPGGYEGKLRLVAAQVHVAGAAIFLMKIGRVHVLATTEQEPVVVGANWGTVEGAGNAARAADGIFIVDTAAVGAGEQDARSFHVRPLLI